MKILRESNIHEVLDKWTDFEKETDDFKKWYQKYPDKIDAIKKYRQTLISPVYNKAKWHYVKFEENDLHKMKAINCEGWNHIPSLYIKDVAKYRFEKEKPVYYKLEEIYNDIQKLPEEKKELICICKDIAGPWTIIEGNHRATAFARYYDIEKKVVFTNGYVGIIPTDLEYPFM